MQVLAVVGQSPEGYELSGAYCRMAPPCGCPNCGSQRKLRPHGYYQRGVSSQRGGFPVVIHVRRFRCRGCRRTTSMLPLFAQPYRLVRNETIGRFFRDGSLEACDLKWLGLLLRYRHTFFFWWPVIRRALNIPPEVLSVPIAPGCYDAWRSVEDRFQTIDYATHSLVEIHQITLFGSYKCHKPLLPDKVHGHDHTTLLFPSGADPPR